MFQQTRNKLCECGCGKELPFNNRRKYFSSPCRQKAYRDFKAKRTAQPDDLETSRERAIHTKQDKVKSRICPSCNQYFGANGSQGKKIYCSDACKQKAYNERKAWEKRYNEEPEAIIPHEPTIAVIVIGSDDPEGDVMNMLLAAHTEQQFDNTGE